MDDFTPGAPVLFTRGPSDHVAVVREPAAAGDKSGYIIDVIGGDGWFVGADKLTPIPAGSPLFALGETVRVHSGAPLFSGRTGTVAVPALRDGRFGYWLHLDGSLEWVPAVALDPAEAGDPR